jgi:hypothetical protein
MQHAHFPALYTASELRRAAGRCASAAAIEEWVRRFCANSHPDLGRPGPVCPFVPEALRIDSLWFTTIRTKDAHNEEKRIQDAVHHYRELFPELVPRAGVDSIYKSVLLIFPDARPSAIERVQRNMKAGMVRLGLMLGEFHPEMPAGARHNPEFHALRSPVAMLVIRTLVAADLEFLLRKSDPLPVRTSCVESYLQLLGPHLIRERRESAEAALEELKRTPVAVAAGGSRP